MRYQHFLLLCWHGWYGRLLWVKSLIFRESFIYLLTTRNPPKIHPSLPLGGQHTFNCHECALENTRSVSYSNVYTKDNWTVLRVENFSRHEKNKIQNRRICLWVPCEWKTSEKLSYKSICFICKCARRQQRISIVYMYKKVSKLIRTRDSQTK